MRPVAASQLGSVAAPAAVCTWLAGDAVLVVDPAVPPAVVPAVAPVASVPATAPVSVVSAAAWLPAPAFTVCRPELALLEPPWLRPGNTSATRQMATNSMITDLYRATPL